MRSLKTYTFPAFASSAGAGGKEALSSVHESEDACVSASEKPVDRPHGVYQVSHGFYTRQGGVSQGGYWSLNCGTFSGDKLAGVRQNLERVRQHMNASYLAIMQQTHSNVCALIDKPGASELKKADALVCNIPGIALGVVTADCVPVLLRGEDTEKRPIIGAAHAGWRGAVGGIIENTLVQMDLAGVVRGSLRAAIGPSIRQASYEVGDDLYREVCQAGEESERFFMTGRQGSLWFDLCGYVAFRLAGAGVKNVFISPGDTYVQEDDFFSHRRMTHRKELGCGRQISCIMILP